MGGDPAGTLSETPSTGRLISDDVWGILTTFAESRGEPYEGQLAVARVIRNRTRRAFSSDGTVCGTVLSPYQFSCWNTGDGQRTRIGRAMWDEPAMRQCVRAWFEAEFRDVVPADCLWYHTSEVDPSWAKAHGITFFKEIGRHRFYVESLRV